MFPDYVNNILSQARCGHCETPQTIADIRVVGVCRPEEFEAFRGEPVFIIIMNCDKCGQWTNHTIRRSRTDAIAGCNSFIDLIEQESHGKTPPINIPGLVSKAKPVSSAQPAPDFPARPSIREGQPDTPPTQREIQFFLHRLKRTSFKRGSKGFKNWMKDIGADGDPHGEDQMPK